MEQCFDLWFELAVLLIKKMHPTDGSNVQNGEATEKEVGFVALSSETRATEVRWVNEIARDPENLRLMNQAELQLHAIKRKVDLYAQKEELFFAIDERAMKPISPRKGAAILVLKIRMPSCCRTEHGIARH